ncbi:MAG: type II toxin-antitoxin system RelE/ParE family toxin [Thermoleophilaceae bacterium]|nr:type II toxin-antitoxin system RelE/ParE family toxin [Thermoleophilaceae bacterium]
MATVELTRLAVDELETLIRTHSLPADTKQRVQASLRPLERFPRVGPELSGRYSGLRFLLGPWRWLLLVYTLDEANDRVTVVSVQDARSSGAATGTR